MAAIVLVVELEIASGEKERFLARVRRHRENVLENEPGCRQFDILAPQGTKDAVILVETYADTGALEAHLETPYMKEYQADTGPMISNRKRIPCDLVNE